MFWAIGLICGALYGAMFCWAQPSVLKTSIKTAALGSITFALAFSGAPVLLVLALAASTVGDWALAAPGERRFLIGLIGFATAHLFYILLFWTMGPGLNLPLIVAFAALALSTFKWLLPYTGALRGAVTGYVALISVMGGLAAGLDRMILIGAASFAASDTVLAYQLFRMPEGSRWQVPASIVLWLLYFGGQLLIVLAVMGLV